MNIASFSHSLLFTSFLLVTSCLGHIARDLELDTIFHTIDNTHTVHGKNHLHQLLFHPTDNISTLKNRQSTIAYLHAHETLQQELSESFDALELYTPYFERVAQKISPIQNAALSEFYFSSSYFKKWNYNPLGLEIGQLANCANLFSSVIQHALAFALFTWGLEEEHVCAVHPAKKHKHHNHDKKHHHHDHKECSHHHDKSQLKKLLQSPGVKNLFQAWHSIAQVQELYAFCTVMNNKNIALQSLQKEMIGLSNALKTIKHLYAITKEHGELRSGLTHYHNLENICTSHHISAKLAQLLQLLETPTFTGQPSLFSRTGNILTAYKLAHEVAHQLTPAFKALGEIDAFLSCAQLLNTHVHQSHAYTFAQYKENAITPHIAAEKFWHPLLCCRNKNVHYNSINLGTDSTPSNIIITAPNESGKSTNLKTIALCTYFAQTITLVPAQKFSLTPYKKIHTSIVVQDEIENNLSLFATELTRAEQLLENVDTLNENEFIFIALDELFKSTHHEKGQKVAGSLLKKLYKSPQITSIVSTHFEQLTQLAQEHNVENYTVHNFVLKPGIGSSHDSFEIVNKKRKSILLGDA